MSLTGLTITGYIRNINSNNVFNIECPIQDINDCKAYTGYFVDLPDEIDTTELKEQLNKLVTVNVTTYLDKDNQLIKFRYAGKFVLKET